MQSHAHAATDKAARYMTQLAKHWSHKFEVELNERQASIVFPLGVARMTAGPGALDVVLEGADAQALDRFESVFAEHLARFAFREPELKLDWRREG